MAESIGNMFVQLGIDSKGFSAGMQRAGTALGSFAQHVKSIDFSTKITALYNGYQMALGTARQLWAVTMGIAREIDATGDRAKALGIEYRDMLAVQRTADREGVSLGAMEMALKRSAISVGENNPGLAKIGLSASQLRNLPRMEQLMAIADGLGAIRNESARAAIAQDILGRSGAELATVFATGSAVLRQHAAEIERLGAVSNEAAAEIGEAYDGIGDAMTAATNAAVKSYWWFLKEIRGSYDNIGAMFGLTMGEAEQAYWAAEADKVRARWAERDKARAAEMAAMAEATAAYARMFSASMDAAATHVAARREYDKEIEAENDWLRGAAKRGHARGMEAVTAPAAELSAAILKGSQADYSIMARGPLVAAANEEVRVAKRQLDEAVRANGNLREIKQALNAEVDL